LRNIVTAILALAVSTFVAGMAAVVIAERAQAQEEFILVFVGLLPLGLVCAVPLFAASFTAAPGRTVSRVARWLFVILALLVAALFGYAFYVAQAGIGVVRDLPILAGLSIPAAIILFLQWAIFRWRARAPAGPAPMQFGRSGGAA
jgi:hypothetical protein